jgi:hypothetical protein
LTKVFKAFQWTRVCALIAFFLVCMPAMNSLHAQVTTATISGSVTDSSGAAIADAAIQVKNTGTGLSQSTNTDGQGRFNVPSLAVGDYEVEASKAGFATAVRTNISLTVGASFVTDFALQVGQSNQTVTVQAETAQVDTTSSTLANLVETKQMVDLPLNGRNFQQLILLSPGVNVAQTSTTSFYGKGDTYSIAGARPEGAAYLLDGTDITNFFNHGSGAGSLGTSLGIDAIAEFQTLTNTYSAQFGGNGAVINAVSKSGTNSYHGTAFEFLRNSDLDARDFFAPTSSPPPFRRNQFGGALGGPIKKDKMFFFVNYEALRQSLGITNKITVPDANAHNGYLPCAAAAGVPCGGNGLAYVGFASPAIASAMALFPTATIPLSGGIGNAFANGTQVGNEYYLLGRFDYTLSSRDSIFTRYVMDSSSFTNPFPGTNAAGWPDSEPTRNQYVTVEERHILSASLINVARASFVRTENSATSLTTNAALQFAPHLGGQDGNITVTGLTGLGPSALTPYSLIQNKFAESDDIYWTHGAHSIKFGLGLNRVQTFENQPFSGAGAYTFPSLLGFLQGTPNRYGGAYPVGYVYPGGETSLFGNYNPDAYRAFRETLVTPYINDDWKVNSKLTVNIGLRYDFDTNPKSAMNNLLVITNPPFNSVGGPISKGFTQVPNVWRHNPSLNNWGPRLGLAYDPFKDHKTSFRAGFGDNHNVLAPRVFTSGYVTGPPFASVIVTPNPSQPVIPYPNPFVGTVTPPLPSNGQTVDYNDTKTPAIYQWNANVQHELPGDVILTVGYVGSHGSHLVTQSDQNPPIEQIINGVAYFGNPATGLSFPRWSPSFGAINALQANGRSSYNSLQVNAVHRFSRNFQAQVAYTWAHSIDDGSGSSGLETGGGPRSDPYDFALDRGSSTFDARQALRINGVYTLPFKKNRLVSGWQISGILSKSTGLPLLLTTGFDRELVGPSSTVNERPNLVPGYTAQSIVVGSVNEWFNPAAFVLQPLGTMGNLGRDIIRGPGVFNSDISLLKDTRIRERFVLQFRAEFFNFLNHENFGTPNLTLFTTAGANSAAGQITTSNPGTIPRQIQFALKLNF